MSGVPSSVRADAFRSYALAALLAAMAWRGLDIFHVLSQQPPGADYSCFWAGLQALKEGRPYDFAHVTGLQGWPLGPGQIRPYIYPPSAGFVFAPFAALPYWLGYTAWVAATYALMAWAGLRMGARWWMALFPVAWLVAICGQVTFLIGGLVAAALVLLRARPVAAGVLLGVAAGIKPQMLIFAPLALLAAGQWRALFAMGASGLLMCAASAAIWGVDTWVAWLEALGRFHRDVVLPHPGLLEDGITPYAMLTNAGLAGSWAFLLAPFAIAVVWFVFRRTDSAPDRLVAVIAAALTVSPYAMNYEAALLLPAVAAYLARRGDRLWPLYAAVACVYTVGLVHGAAPVAAALVLPLSSLLRRAATPPGVRLAA